jgi:hypothetical protein
MQDDIKYVKAEELIAKISVDSLPASYYFPIVLFDWLKARSHPPRHPQARLGFHCAHPPPPGDAHNRSGSLVPACR